jgi:hypothetical protein
VDSWLHRFRRFWTQPLDALATEVARGKRKRRAGSSMRMTASESSTSAAARPARTSMSKSSTDAAVRPRRRRSPGGF